MLTIRPMSSGEGYSANYLEQSDYLSEHHKIKGQWFGKGAERLGLKGEVAAADFEALREGLHPQTGEKLRPRMSANRIDPNGKIVSQGRELYDLTISAPKSLSIMACIGGDKRLLELHEQAVKEALLEAERCAQTRVRKDNEQTNRLTGNLVTASYTHDAIRADRRVHNELGEEQTFTRLEPLNFTLAEKKDFRNYEPGMRLVFHRPTVDAERHEIFEILSVKDNAVLVRGQDGNETEVTQKQAKSFGVFAAREIQVAPGDLLMLQQNRRSPDLRATNGEFAAVKQITPQGHIELEGGRVLTEDYQCFTYGYASTVHKAQGKTVDNVIVSGNVMDRRQFYVATSRGRESIQVFTGNIEELRDSIGVSGARQSATELATRAMEDGMEQARREMWWIDYETGAPTQDATRSQPQPGRDSRAEREGRHYEWEHAR